MLGKIVSILSIIGAVVGLVIVVEEMPNIDVAFYLNHDSNNMTWASSNFYASISKDDTSAPQPQTICFRVTNLAQAIVQNFEIPASNLQVTINTNVKCPDCNSNSNIGKLVAQNSEDVCKNMYISNETSELTFNTISSWDSLIGHQNKIKNFNCEKTGIVNYKNQYHCI